MFQDESITHFFYEYNIKSHTIMHCVNWRGSVEDIGIFHVFIYLSIVMGRYTLPPPPSKLRLRTVNQNICTSNHFLPKFDVLEWLNPDPNR